MIYDDAIKAIFKSHGNPYPDLVVDLVEHEYWLTVRLYRDNFEKFGHFQKIAIVNWVSELMKDLNSVTKTYLEVFPTAPK